MSMAINFLQTRTPYLAHAYSLPPVHISPALGLAGLPGRDAFLCLNPESDSGLPGKREFLADIPAKTEAQYGQSLHNNPESDSGLPGQARFLPDALPDVLPDELPDDLAEDLPDDDLPEIAPGLKVKHVSTSLCGGWRGAKTRLVKKILPLFPDHVCYVEPFCGGASLFFAKMPGKVEVLNDRNHRLINMFRVVRDQPEALFKYCHWAVHSRSEFNHWRDYTGDDPVKKAWSLLYIIKSGFGGRMDSPGFGYQVKSRRSLINSVTPALISKCSQRLKYAIIECLDFREIFKRYDSPQTFFYVDPPYIGHEKDYGSGLYTPADFFELADILKKIKGKFLLSINDHEAARETFADDSYKIIELKTVYLAANGANKKVGELAIMNYEPPVLPQTIVGKARKRS